MREFMGILLFVILLTLWSTLFSQSEDDSVALVLNSEISDKTNIQAHPQM